MREPDVDRERDAAPAAPAQLTVMSSGSAARPGPEGPSGIVRVEPETRSERVESRSWASELPAAMQRPESRLFGPGIPEVGIGVPGTKPRTGSGGPETTAAGRGPKPKARGESAATAIGIPTQDSGPGHSCAPCHFYRGSFLRQTSRQPGPESARTPSGSAVQAATRCATEHLLVTRVRTR